MFFSVDTQNTRLIIRYEFTYIYGGYGGSCFGLPLNMGLNDIYSGI